MPRTAVSDWRWLAALIALLLAPAAWAQEGAPFDFGIRRVTYVDETRSIKASMGFAGAPARKLEIVVWYPAKPKGKSIASAPFARGGPWPLVIYSHGTYSHAASATHIAEDLARHGYVVAAPDYPLTSRTAWTGVTGADISDVANQVKDVGFVISRLTSDPVLAPQIDREKIGVTGISLGAVTSYFTVWGMQTRDARIKAVAPIAGGDPVQAAFTQDMGLSRIFHTPVPVPALFLTADRDLFARMMGRSHASYARVEGPKYEVDIRGGAHVWFSDGSEVPADGKNPDCLWFERSAPGMKVPGCEERGGLIDPFRQKLIARTALRAFFDGYLKGDAAALARLKAIPAEFAEAKLEFEE